VRFGSRKFRAFEPTLVGISSNTLSARLERLEDAEIVERRFYEQHECHSNPVDAFAPCLF